MAISKIKNYGLSLLVVLGASCASSSTVEKPISQVTISVVENRIMESSGFSWVPPEGWEVSYDGELHTAVAPKNETGFRSNIQWIEDEFTGSASDYIADIRTQIKAVMPPLSF